MPPVVLWWGWLVFAAVNVAAVALQAPGRFALEVTSVIATVTGVVYAGALRPRVVADDAGLRVLNPFRDHIVPWGNVLGIDVGEWVRVRYTRGAAAGDSPKTVESWALFVPARTRLRAQRRARDPAARTAAGRLPFEARRMLTLSPAQAMAKQLDDRAAAERDAGAQPRPATTRWAWPSLAGIVVPALALIVILLA